MVQKRRQAKCKAGRRVPSEGDDCPRVSVVVVVVLNVLFHYFKIYFNQSSLKFGRIRALE